MQIMNSSFPVLSLLVALPFVASLLLWLVKPLHKFARVFGLVVAGISFATTIVLACTFDYTNSAAYQFSETHAWMPSLGVSWAVGVNALGLAMILLSAFCVLIVLIASARQDYSDPEQAYDDYGYVSLILALFGFMMMIFTARDVFVFYLAFEAMLVPLYFLVARYGNGEETARKKAAMKLLLYSLLGGLVMLIGIVGVWVYSPLQGNKDGIAGLFLLENLEGKLVVSSSVEMALFFCFFFAFAVKAPMVPVHTWLAPTTENARPGTSALLVGILDKIGTFGMITMCLTIFPGASRRAALVIIVLAVISVIYGSLAAIAQKDLMRLTSFSSVAHFGLMVMAIFSGNTLALTGAMFYMVAHGLSITGMFLLGGALTERGGTQEIDAFGGMQRVTPVLAGTFLVVGLAAIALPGLSGFPAEFMVFVGVFKTHAWAACLSLIGVVLGAVYLLWPYQRMFAGQPKENRKGIKDLGMRERLGVAAPLIAVMLILGLAPHTLSEPLNGVSEQVVKIQPAPQYEISVTPTEGSSK